MDLESKKKVTEVIFPNQKKEKQAKCTRNRHAIEHMHVMFHPALDDTISYLVKGDTWT